MSRTLKTPWGDVTIPDVVPMEYECGQCGRCCRGFVLSMRDYDKQVWYERFLKLSPYEYPKDIGAIVNLMIPIPDAFSESGEQIHTCGAFDAKEKTCSIFADAPQLRPIACWAFPYNLDWQDIFRFSFPGCAIFQKTLIRILDGYFEGIAATYDPLAQKQKGQGSG